jgi:hypothetical protein
MVSCICTTYRRHYCVERIITMWKYQDYSNKELIIYNTDLEHPMALHHSLKNENIVVINKNIDDETGHEYTNTGAIRRDAVKYASGKYFMLWDDDDLYLHFNLRQAVDQINKKGKKAWKPQKSFFLTQDKLELVRNTMEASVIVEMDSIREIGFRYDSGYESLSWYTKLRDMKELNEYEEDYIPMYCFNWSDSELAGHKQSGDIDNPDNFENHKRESKNYSDKPLEGLDYQETMDILNPLYNFIKINKNLFSRELYKTYMN